LQSYVLVSPLIKSKSMEIYKIYVGGEFRETNLSLDVQNPYNNEVFARTFLSGKNELEIAISRAESVLDELKEIPVYQRYEILLQISERLKREQERLAGILAQESAKPLKYAIREMLEPRLLVKNRT